MFLVIRLGWDSIAAPQRVYKQMCTILLVLHFAIPDQGPGSHRKSEIELAVNCGCCSMQTQDTYREQASSMPILDKNFDDEQLEVNIGR